MTGFRIFGVAILIMAVLVGVVPYFNNCEHDGKLLTLNNGRQVPMKCAWTARAEIATAVPLFLLGGLLAFSRRKETRRFLDLLGMVLGVFVMLLPTTLIGVCATMTASCNLVMKPAMLLIGGLIIVANLGSLGVSELRSEGAI